MQDFIFDDWFDAPKRVRRAPEVSAALEYADSCGIRDHAFFQVARSDPAALKVWVCQELVVTGPFSQALLRLAAQISNVHLRSMVMVVINGEHGRLKGMEASNAHPWLLNQLRISMNLRREEVQPVAETLEFLATLDKETESILAGLAATGIGNERLILGEYGEIKKCFEECWPQSDYSRFLDANIGEDLRHSEMLCDVASSIIEQHGRAED